MTDPVGYDGERIWLRQSVTGTRDGLTRSVEIAVSVHPGMSANQVDALLGEADVCMQVLSRHLNNYLNNDWSDADGREPAGTPTSGERAVAPPPVAPPPVASSTRPSSTPVKEKPAAAPTSELSVKDFIAAVRAELDLNPKQAMDKLNVKSLTGVNLREALETLRLQPGQSSENPSRGTGQPPAAAAPARASAVPRYFEEEDSEFDVTFSLDGDVLDGEIESANSVHARVPDFGDEFDLEDVPDFTALTPPPQVTAPGKTGQLEVSGKAGESRFSESFPDSGRSQALQIISQLRAAAKGGALTSQQRSAYGNIILQELGELAAKTLVTGLWRVPAERLGAEQLDALLSWGKRDTFGEEASLVLEALRAESERATRRPGTAGRTPSARPPTGGD